MTENKIRGVEFVCIDTDEEHLLGCKNTKVVHIGKAVGSIEGELESTKTEMELADVVFVIVCMGGETGTKIAPAVAQIGKNLRKLVIGVAVRPFNFEAESRRNNADTGIRELERNSDSVMVISNDQFLQHLTNFTEKDYLSSGMASELNRYIESLVDAVNDSGLINFNFEDIKSAFNEKKRIYVGVGTSTDISDDGCRSAAGQAVSNLLMEMELKTASHILVYVSGKVAGLQETGLITDLVEKVAGEDSNIFFGTDDADTSFIRVAIIAVRQEKSENRLESKKRMKVICMAFHKIAGSGWILVDSPQGQIILTENGVRNIYDRFGIDLNDLAVGEDIISPSNLKGKKPCSRYLTEIVCSTLTDLPLGFTIHVGKFPKLPDTKRFCYNQLWNFLNSDTSNRVAMLYGTRRTGKTILMQQTVNELIQSGIPIKKIAFITIQKNAIDGNVLCDYVRHLLSFGVKYLFIDELTYVTGNLNWTSILSDNTPGKMVVLAATDSLMFKELTRTVLFDEVRKWLLFVFYFQKRKRMGNGVQVNS